MLVPVGLLHDFAGVLRDLSGFLQGFSGPGVPWA